MYKGKLIRLKIDGDYVPCELSCEINVNQETLPVTNNTQGRARSYIRGYYDWTVTLDSRFSVNAGNSSSYTLLNRILQDGDGVITFDMVSHDASNAPFIISGSMIPTTWNISAGVSGMATNNVTFQGSGELTFDAELYWNIINAMPIQDDKPNIIQW